jgi:ribosomal protein L11 methyltransferase
LEITRGWLSPGRNWRNPEKFALGHLDPFDELRVNSRRKAFLATPSYEELYIYLIKGLVSREEESAFGLSFLGNWVEEDTCFLFFKEPAEAIVTELLKRHSDLQLLENDHFSYEEWQGDFSEPIKIDRFLIVPPWLNASEGQGETKILLDPGLVFGTGLHASTRDSLKALSYVHAHFPVTKVVDLGTGTGVLALASALLGAQEVLAVDLNPLCVNTARKNARYNHLESRIEVKEGRAEDFAELQADLVLANIHWDVLKTLLKKERFRKNPWIVLAGMMRSHARDLESDLARYGLKIGKAWEDEATWYTILVRGGSAESVKSELK